MALDSGNPRMSKTHINVGNRESPFRCLDAVCCFFLSLFLDCMLGEDLGVKLVASFVFVHCMEEAGMCNKKVA